MGDRGNIVMRYTDKDKKATDIYFYTHWQGSHLPAILKSALARRVRWDDEAYLSRIIFNLMTLGHETEETGFGIAPYPCDNEHDLLIVDHEAHQVIRQRESGDRVARWSFEEFIKLDLAVAFADY